MSPDYHVVSLTYSVTSADDVTYDAPPPLAFEMDGTDFHLADSTLTCHMKTHFASEGEARAAIEPFLRAWELDVDLRSGVGGLRFKFNRADIVDRTAVLPGATVGRIHTLEFADTVTVTATLSKHVIRRAYPAPPGDFRITPDVETLWHRYQAYRDGREPLPAMAYFCLTFLENAAGGKPNARRKAAAKYNVDEQVLNKLGELASNRGDPRTARKMPTPATPPLSGAEEGWIQEAIKELIQRLGDRRDFSTLSTITLTDLPRL